MQLTSYSYSNNMDTIETLPQGADEAIDGTPGDHSLTVTANGMVGLNASITEAESSGTAKRPHDDLEDTTEKTNGKRKCLPIQPKVWAIRRQGLCEALPYYNAYKGSLHTTDNVAQGVYIDAQSRDHDIFKAQVIITTV